MAHMIFEDNAETYLTVAITAADTSFTVNDGSALPVPGAGQIVYATLKRKLTGVREVISYTSNSGGTISGVTRNVNGEGAVTFGVGDLVEIRIPEVVLDQFMQRQGDNGQGDNDFTGDVYWSNTAGPVILNEAATTTNPTLIPNQAELDTGWGWASDTLIAVLGGVQAWTIDPDSIVGNDATLAWVANSVATSAFGMYANDTAVAGSFGAYILLFGPSHATLADDADIGADELNFKDSDGALYAQINSAGFRAANAAGPTVLNEAATGTNPTLIPNLADPDTGIGWSAGDQGALVSAGVLNAIWDSTGVASYGTIGLYASNAAGAALLNEAATTTNPTLIPNRAELDTGWGWASDELHAVLGGSDVFLFTSTYFGGVAVGAGQVLNETAAAANPTLIPYKGDTDTGIGGDGANTGYLIAAGSTSMMWTSTAFLAGDAAGPAMANEAATTTNPTLIPNKAELDTGWGWASDELWAVLGGVAQASFQPSADTYEFSVYNYDADANVGPLVRLLRAKSGSAGGGGTAGTAADSIGTLRFSGYNNAGTPAALDYAFINAVIVDPTSGSEDGEGRLYAVTAGAVSTYWSWTGGMFNASNAAGPALMDEAATTTNPTLVPNRAESNTGWGWATNRIHGVIVGANTWEFSAGDFRASTTGGGQILAETASAGNPTIIPYADDADTGIGGDGSNNMYLIAGNTTVVDVSSTGISLNNLLIGQAELKDYGVTYATASSSAGTLTLNYNNAQVYQVTLAENITTVTITNPPASGTYGEIMVRFVQGASAYTITYSATYKFQGGTDHTMSTGSGDVDWVVFRTKDGGTTWEVDFGQDYS